MKLSFITANYVGRSSGYRLDPFDWGQAERATIDDSSTLQLDRLFSDIVRAGFCFIELWQAHAWPEYISDEVASEIRTLLEKHSLTCIGYAGWVGGEPGIVEQKFRTCARLGIPQFNGGLDAGSVPFVYDLCKEYGVRVGIENHPEKSPEEVLAKIDGYGEWIGATVDTGWWTIHGYDAATAVRDLRDHLFHVHLKDMSAVGSHESCELGQGVTNIESVVAALNEVGYEGTLSIEHEPAHRDPMPEVVRSKEFLKRLGISE